MSSSKLMKSISIFLICSLAFALPSCKTGSHGGNSTDTGDNTTGNLGDTIEETTALSEFQPLEGVDFGGYKFRIFGPGPNPVVWDSSMALGTLNEIAPEEETGDPINDSVYRRNREVEALYNIEIVPVFPGGDRGALEQAALKSIKAGDDAYDAALIIGWTMRTILGSNSHTYDLLQVPNLDVSNSWWNQKSVSELSVANQLHMVTGDISVMSAFSMNVLFQNKELVKQYGLENAYDLVRQGKWTWDRLIEMCRAVARDLDGDGAMTGADLFGICGEHATIRFALQSSGERITKKDADDIPYLAINTETTTKVLDYALESFLNRDIGMYVDDYIGKYRAPYEEFILPKFNSGEILFFAFQMFGALDWRGLEWDFGILPYPKLSEQQGEYYTSTAMWYETHVYIPATCPDIGRTGAVIDALGYYSQKYIRPTVIDVTVTNKLVRDDDSAEMIDLLLDTRTYDLGAIYNWGDIDANLLFSGAKSRTNVFASQYEKHADKIKTAMEKTISEMLK